MPAGMVIIREDRCKGCGMCLGVCPQGILELAQQRFNVKGYHPVELSDSGSCTGCAICAAICPDVVFTVYRRRRPVRGPAREKGEPLTAAG